jgi:hypothetical protein
MTTIEAQIPEPVLHQAEELAAREHIPLDQVISLAITQGVGRWSNDNDIILRAKNNSRDKFLNALSRALDTEPPNGDCEKI